MPPSLSIVIPVYNEASTIVASLNEVDSYLRSCPLVNSWEVIVVNDGSDDGTLAVLAAMGDCYPELQVVDLGRRTGRGAALRAGLRAANGEFVISLDADLSYAPYHIERILAAFEGDSADLVLASAYGPGGTVRNVPFFRLLLSRLGNLVLAFMFRGDVHTLTCMVRGYRKQFIDSLDLHSLDKEVHLEILAKARILGGRITEVPADLHWRQEKLLKLEANSTKPRRRSTLTVRKTSNSHLFFALLNRPGLIFWFPGTVLLGVAALCLGLIAASLALDAGNATSLFQTVRASMLKASPTWMTMLAAFVLGTQFFTLGFLTHQAKRNQEDQYRTLNSIYNELRWLRNSRRMD